MFVIVTILGVFLFPEIRHQLKQREVVEKLKPIQDTNIYYDYDLVTRPSWDETDWQKYFPPVRSKIAGMTKQCFGTDIFNPVIYLYLSDESAESIDQISYLRHLKWLQIGNPTGPLQGRNIPSLESVANCTHLEYLALGNWFHLSNHPEQLPEFRGNGTIILPYDISESDIQVIGNLKMLRVLAIGGCNVNDKSIEPICNLPNLEYLYLSRSKITDEGVRLLQAALPDLVVSTLPDHNYDYAAEIQSRYQ